MPREVITIHIGQAGVQIGNAVWELLCAEHGIAADGSVLRDTRPEYQGAVYDTNAAESFFYLGQRGQFVPRALFTDLEGMVIQQLRTGHYRELFHPDYLVHGNEDASNIFSRGYHSLGSIQITPTMECIRALLEDCESLEGLMLIHAIGGGTGSGYSSLLIEQLHEEMPKTTKVECMISPSGSFASNLVEPYNALLTTHYGMPTADVSFIWDNDALYNICTSQLGLKNPTFTHVNRILSQIFSSMTSCVRFGGYMSCTLLDYQTNLVPYPRIHFPITSFSPLSSLSRSEHEAKGLEVMTKNLFRKQNMMCTCNTESGKYVSCCLMYRGGVTPSDVHTCIKKLKATNKFQFVDWCPTGMKISISGMPSITVSHSFMAPTKHSAMLMSNNSAVGEVFARLNQKFLHLHMKRAFIHWFVGEGMEEGEFKDAKDDIDALVNDYQMCCEETNANANADVNNDQDNQNGNGILRADDDGADRVDSPDDNTNSQMGMGEMTHEDGLEDEINESNSYIDASAKRGESWNNQ